MRHYLFAFGLLLTGCNTPICGPGTKLVDNVCVVATGDSTTTTGAGGAMGTGGAAGSSSSSSSGATGTGGSTGAQCPVVGSPSSTPGAVSCMAETCSGTDTCVIDPFTSLGSCEPPGSQKLKFVGAVLRYCDEAADCDAGAVCCEVFTGVASWYGVTTTCQSSCEFGEAAQACRTDGECGTTHQCATYQVTPKLAVSTCHIPIGCN